MKYLLTFDENCPENMGKSQLTDDIQTFLDERKELLPNATSDGKKITYDGGTATIKSVPDDFDNCK